MCCKYASCAFHTFPLCHVMEIRNMHLHIPGSVSLVAISFILNCIQLMYLFKIYKIEKPKLQLTGYLKTILIQHCQAELIIGQFLLLYLLQSLIYIPDLDYYLRLHIQLYCAILYVD